MASLTKGRNYNVDFWRIFLTLCFVAVHTFIVIPPKLGAKPLLTLPRRKSYPEVSDKTRADTGF